MAGKDDPQKTRGWDSLDELEVQLSLEDHAWSMIVVESVSGGDRDGEAVCRTDVGLGRVFVLGREERKRLCDSEHLSFVVMLLLVLLLKVKERERESTRK